MLKDEEAISAVANAIMMADWRWDIDYQNEQGTKKTKYSYRSRTNSSIARKHFS
jgi:hypothetical protein